MIFLEQIKDLILRFWEILGTPLAEISVLHLVIVSGFSVLIFFVLKSTIKVLREGYNASKKLAKKGISKLRLKNRAAKLTCLHCGRTLDKCVCNSNKGVSLRKRVRKHKKELKERRKAALAQFSKK